jgi:HEXXH motif-containing protein
VSEAILSDSFNPWRWQPGKTAWFRLVEAQLAVWEPADGLLADVRPVRRSLCHAAQARAPWLYDPAAAALLAPRIDNSWIRDVQLIALIAAQDVSVAACRLNVPAATELWLGTRLTPVAPGKVVLGDLLSFPQEGPAAGIGSLDLYARSVVAQDGDLWRSPEEMGDHRARVLGDLFSQVQAVLDRLAGCRSWLEPVFRVVIPTKSENTTQSSSRSCDFFPGTVFADWQSGLESAVEALVHESAHHYFHLHELGGHLVSPAYRGLAWSPLARRHRPLTRVLLAYHAVAYMSCLYRDWLDSGSADAGVAAAALEALRVQADDYRQIIADELSHLTARGVRFSRATAAVAAHGLRAR